MKEDFLQYVWQQALFPKNGLVTTEGEAIEVISLGTRNRDAGPDFFNAKLRIGDTLWGGTIEVHVRSSDWDVHGHQHNEAYNSVVLHVVEQHDKTVKRASGLPVPTLELPISETLSAQYADLMGKVDWIRCASKISAVDQFSRTFWLEKLLIERLQQRSLMVEQLLDQTKQSWEETLYLMLARGFGFGLNADAFEQLARSLPLLVLAKHKASLLQLEALLFGQAGLLDLQNEALSDEYTTLLQREYKILRQKFSLEPISGYQWKFLRLRPANFPTLRIAQFAALLHRSSSLFSKLREVTDVQQMTHLFECRQSDYWQTHYVFGKKGTRLPQTLGKDAQQLLVINSVLPVLFVWAQQHSNEAMHNRVLSLLEQMSGEHNAIVEQWHNLGFETKTAAQTQALLFAYNSYCQKGACLQCDIGRKLLNGRVKQ